MIRWLAASIGVLVVAIGCAEKSAKEPSDSGAAMAIEYGAMPNHVGKRVTVVGWVLGAGESFHVEESASGAKYYFVLVNEPEVDWEAFFKDYEDTEKLVRTLGEGERAGSSSSKEVRDFSRLQDAFLSWRGLILGQEARDDVTAWTRFSDNPISAEFKAVPEGPLVLVRPTREELASAAERLLDEYRAIERSAEVRVTGLLTRSSAGEDGERRAKNLEEALQKKPFLILVERYEILRTARDMLTKAPTVGADELVDPGTVGSGGGNR